MQVKVSALLLEKEEAQEAALTAEAHIVDLKVKREGERKGGKERSKWYNGHQGGHVLGYDKCTHCRPSSLPRSLPPPLPPSLVLRRPASFPH